jgi:hypothetical protein
VQVVGGSNPLVPTNKINGLPSFLGRPFFFYTAFSHSLSHFKAIRSSPKYFSAYCRSSSSIKDGYSKRNALLQTGLASNTLRNKAFPSSVDFRTLLYRPKGPYISAISAISAISDDAVLILIRDIAMYLTLHPQPDTQPDTQTAPLPHNQIICRVVP